MNVQTIKLATAAIWTVAAILPTYAATVTVGGTVVLNEGQTSSVAGVTTATFNALSIGGPQSFTQGIAQYTNLTVLSGNGTDLVNDSSRFADVSVANTGDLTINFSQPIVYFGLYWGSPDRLNTVTFFQGANAIFTYTGLNLNTQFGVPLGLAGSSYVNFAAGAGLPTSVSFSGDTPTAPVTSGCSGWICARTAQGRPSWFTMFEPQTDAEHPDLASTPRRVVHRAWKRRVVQT